MLFYEYSSIFYHPIHIYTSINTVLIPLYTIFAITSIPFFYITYYHINPRNPHYPEYPALYSAPLFNSTFDKNIF